jgi:hypothetical protein
VATKDEKKHFSKLAQIGCVLCWHLGYEETPAEMHHIRRAGKRSTSPVIPLCPEHHRGDSGIHGMGRKAFERRYGITEEALLQIVNEILSIKSTGTEATSQ